MQKFLSTLALCIGLAVAIPAQAQTYGFTGPTFTTNAGVAGGYSGSAPASVVPQGNVVPHAVGATPGLMYPTNSFGQPFIWPIGTPNKYKEIAFQLTGIIVSNGVDGTVPANTSNLVAVLGANMDGNPTNFGTNFYRFTNAVGTNFATGSFTSVFPTNSGGIGFVILDHFENYQTNAVAPTINMMTKPGF